MAEQVKDIVCGMALDPYTDPVWCQYGGQRYYFCSPTCKQTFEQNPGKYVSNL